MAKRLGSGLSIGLLVALAGCGSEPEAAPQAAAPGSIGGVSDAPHLVPPVTAAALARYRAMLGSPTRPPPAVELPPPSLSVAESARINTAEMHSEPITATGE